MMTGLLLSLCLLVPSAQAAEGQRLSARASIAPKTVALGKSVRLTLTLTVPRGLEAEVDLPESPGYGVSFVGRSASSMMKDGKLSGAVVHEYDLYPKIAGKMRVGGIRVAAGGQVARTEALEVEVVNKETAAAKPVAPLPTAPPPAAAPAKPAAPAEETVDRLTDKIKTDEDRRKFLATRQYIERNKGKAPKDATPSPMPDDVDIRFARTESERRFLLDVAAVGAIQYYQNAPPRPPAGPAALASLESLTPAERTAYDKLTADAERRKFLATREYLRNNQGKEPSAASPKPMPDDVDIRHALDEKERKFLLSVAMDEF